MVLVLGLDYVWLLDQRLNDDEDHLICKQWTMERAGVASRHYFVVTLFYYILVLKLSM
jgi:hypothetical protein